ncbi:MAG: hypothetical protein HC884_15290 [Chloroflexaceae bacterium]|nr:hypothetical protein [Chloroflexaceae bacterium]
MLLDSEQVNRAVARLDAWLETMRGPGGYGGPVAHWWQQSLVYTGPGHDWRYEGIIAGYLQLWKYTGERRWLDKVRRAGDDLVDAQLENGHFAASVFELNPATAGTPHEAGCDSGLLLLALLLREQGDPSWERYAACAERNVRCFYIEQLWDESMQAFRDDPRAPAFVPNKAATVCETMFLMAEATGQDIWVEHYAMPTIRRILAHQVTGGPFDGAMAQNSLGPRRIEKYFPIYNARCVSALLRGYRWTNQESYADAALRVMGFLRRWMAPDGSLPTVIYPNRSVNRYPLWIAPLGDVLHAANVCRSYGFEADFSETARWVLAGQDETGGIQTARGFAAQAGGTPGSLPDVRDVLHVVGWCDKVFRFLSAHVRKGPLPVATSDPFEQPCTFRGRSLLLTESPTELVVAAHQEPRYRWHKGQPWAGLAAPEFWLR